MPNAAAPHSPCLDAETLAAWAEGGLSTAEVAEVELHLSNCARCQAVLASLARTETSAPATILPFRLRMSGRWLAPLAAAAAVLIWVAIPKHQPPLDPARMVARGEVPPQAVLPQTTSVTGSATAEGQIGQTPTPARQSPVIRPSITQRTTPDNLRSDQGSRALAAPIQANAPPPPAPAAPLPAPPPPPASQLASPEVQPAFPAAQDAVLPRSAAAQSGASSRTAGALALDSIRATAAGIASSNVVIMEIIPGEAASGRQGTPGGGRGGAGAGGGRAGGFANVAAVAAPVRWRVLQSGAVQRTADGGRSWEPIAFEPLVKITAGAAPSPLVCWLIGREGVVFLTIDGIRFNRVPFPDTGDLVSIRATSARDAVVTSLGGRVLTTNDGGQSWRPPQGFSPPSF